MDPASCTSRHLLVCIAVFRVAVGACTIGTIAERCRGGLYHLELESQPLVPSSCAERSLLFVRVAHDFEELPARLLSAAIDYHELLTCFHIAPTR